MKLGPGRLKLTMAPDNIGENPGLQPFDNKSGIALRVKEDTTPAEFLVHLKAALDAIYFHCLLKLTHHVAGIEGEEEARKIDPSYELPKTLK